MANLTQIQQGMKDLLTQIHEDLSKAISNANKAASQRVRTGTIKLEKLAKQFRKQSVKADKETKGRKKVAKASKPKTAKKATAKKATSAKKTVKTAKKTMTKKTTAKKAAVKKSPAKKAAKKTTTKKAVKSKAKSFAVRRSTAKIRRASR